MRDARQLLQDLRERQDREDAIKAEGRPMQAATQNMAEGLLGNVLGVPEFLARGVRGASNVVRGATGQEMQPIPAGGLLGLPSGREALAGIESVPNLLGMDSPSYDENLARRNAQEQDNPLAAMAGSVGADVATIAAGRSPFVKGPGGVFDKTIASSIDDVVKSASGKTTGAPRFIADVMDSPLFRETARGMGRSIETGIEGLALASIQNGDPVEAAAMSAGTQVASSLALTAANEAIDFPSDVLGTAAPNTLKGKLGALVVNAAIFGGLMQFAKLAAPGGDDKLLESEAWGYEKVLGTILMGATIGAAGMRSSNNTLGKAFPVFADAINSIPRSAVTSAYSEWSQDERAQKLIDAVIQHPDSLTNTQADKLLEAFKSGDSSIFEDEEIKKLIEAPDPRLANVPEK